MTHPREDVVGLSRRTESIVVPFTKELDDGLVTW
jgi:hypothetical protein